MSKNLRRVDFPVCRFTGLSSPVFWTGRLESRPNRQTGKSTLQAAPFDRSAIFCLFSPQRKRVSSPCGHRPATPTCYENKIFHLFVAPVPRRFARGGESDGPIPRAEGFGTEDSRPQR